MNAPATPAPRSGSRGICENQASMEGHGAIRVGLIAGGLALTITSGACGSGVEKSQARHLEDSSILSRTAPLEKRLVTQSEVESASDSDATKTFLQLWSLLQFQSWDQAERLFAPGLRRVIGASLLAQALRQSVIVWQGTKPKIVSARALGTAASIRFLGRGEGDEVIATSISFGRVGGAWRVSYFPLLDTALEHVAQLQAQAEIDPLATKPAPEAIRRGLKAAALQSHYLEGRSGANARAAGPPP